MHIAEGVLPAQWGAAYYGAAGILVAKGLRDYRLRAREYPSFKQVSGVMTAAVFIISLLPIPVPIAGTSSHPCGTPLAAILVGPFIAIVMGAVALFLQALFLAHGGLTTLGANTLAMGIGALAGYMLFRLTRRLGLKLVWAAGLAGLIGDLTVYAVTSAQLALALNGVVGYAQAFWAIYLSYLPAQLPLAVAEGAFTGLAVRFLWQRRPDILAAMRVIDGAEAGPEEVPGYEL